MVPRGRVACGTSWTNVCPLIAFRSVRTAVGRRGNMLMKMRPALSILVRSTYILLLTMKRTSGSVAQKHLFCGAGKLASSQHGREGVDSSVCSPCGPSWDSHKPSCACDKVIVEKYFEPQLMYNSSQTISSAVYIRDGTQNWTAVLAVHAPSKMRIFWRRIPLLGKIALIKGWA